jgi:hypothetical protein
MALKTFRVGRVTVETATVGFVTNAALTITLNTGEITAIGQDWRALVALGRQATLSLTCHYDPADTAQALLRTEFMTGDGSLSVVTMYDGSGTFTCSQMMVTSCGITKAVGASDQISFTIESKVEVTYA